MIIATGVLSGRVCKHAFGKPCVLMPYFSLEWLGAFHMLGGLHASVLSCQSERERRAISCCESYILQVRVVPLIAPTMDAGDEKRQYLYFRRCVSKASPKL